GPVQRLRRPGRGPGLRQERRLAGGAGPGAVGGVRPAARARAVCGIHSRRAAYHRGRRGAAPGRLGHRGAVRGRRLRLQHRPGRQGIRLGRPARRGIVLRPAGGAARGPARAAVLTRSLYPGSRSSGIARTLRGMAIARFPSIVLDCPDAAALAAFYATMLDWKTEVKADWVDIRADYGQCISFQQVDDYTPPKWPGQDVPQQMHLDVVVDDLDTAEAEAIALGATKAEHQPGTTFRVLLDPAGHPFCLCLS